MVKGGIFIYVGLDRAQLKIIIMDTNGTIYEEVT